MKIRAITCGIALSVEDIIEAIDRNNERIICNGGVNFIFKMKFAKEQLSSAANKLSAAGYEVGLCNF